MDTEGTRRVEHHVGWLDSEDRWHRLTAYAPRPTRQEALEDMEEAVGRSLTIWRRDIAIAIKARRVEVRTRTVTITPWVNEADEPQVWCAEHGKSCTLGCIR